MSMIQKAKSLASESLDCSLILSHLIRPKADQDKSCAKEILRDILNINGGTGEGVIKGYDTGYYKNHNPKVYSKSMGGYNSPQNVKAVCFTESTLRGLEAHNEIYKADYGLAFKRSILFEKGANPVINIRESLLDSNVRCILESGSWSDLKHHIPEPLAPFVNIINEKFDATHEREWRIPGDLKFRWDDVFFIFCPENDFAEFKAVQQNGLPSLFDLKWLSYV